MKDRGPTAQTRGPGSKQPETVRVWLLGGLKVSVGSRVIESKKWRLRKAATLIKPGHVLHGDGVTDTLAARNLISGNNDTGIFVSSAANGNSIQGNLIGTHKNGFSPLVNRTGIHIVGGSNNTIGGNGAARNTIAFNRFHGVQVQEVSTESPGTANRIVSNSIFDNAALGIQLGAEAVAGGVTPNDLRDEDTGPNGLQNFPVISSAVISNGSTTIRGSLNSTPFRTFTIQFFNSPAPDPSGNG